MKKSQLVIVGISLFLVIFIPVQKAWGAGKPFPTFEEIRQMISVVSATVDELGIKIGLIEGTTNENQAQIASINSRLSTLETSSSSNYATLIAEIEKIKDTGGVLPESPVNFNFDRPNNELWVDAFSYNTQADTYNAQLVNDYELTPLGTPKIMSSGQGFASVTLKGKTFYGLGAESFLFISNIPSADMSCHGESFSYDFWFYYFGKLHKISKTGIVNFFPPAYEGIPLEHRPNPAIQPPHCSI